MNDILGMKHVTYEVSPHRKTAGVFYPGDTVGIALKVNADVYSSIRPTSPSCIVDWGDNKGKFTFEDVDLTPSPSTLYIYTVNYTYSQFGTFTASVLCLNGVSQAGSSTGPRICWYRAAYPLVPGRVSTGTGPGIYWYWAAYLLVLGRVSTGTGPCIYWHWAVYLLALGRVSTGTGPCIYWHWAVYPLVLGRVSTGTGPLQGNVSFQVVSPVTYATAVVLMSPVPFPATKIANGSIEIFQNYMENYSKSINVAVYFGVNGSLTQCVHFGGSQIINYQYKERGNYTVTVTFEAFNVTSTVNLNIQIGVLVDFYEVNRRTMIRVQKYYNFRIDAYSSLNVNVNTSTWSFVITLYSGSNSFSESYSDVGKKRMYASVLWSDIIEETYYDFDTYDPCISTITFFDQSYRYIMTPLNVLLSALPKISGRAVRTPACSESDQFNMNWQMWKNTGSSDAWTKVNIKQPNAIVMDFTFIKTTGLYKIELNISVTGKMEKESDTMYLNVSLAPLVAKISKGVFRQVKVGSILILDAVSESYDPPLSPGDESNLTFFWSCYKLSQKEEIVRYALPYYHNDTSYRQLPNCNISSFQSIQSKGLLNINTTEFKDKEMILFEVSVSKDSRSEIVTQSVMLLSDQPAEVVIGCVWNCERKLNPGLRTLYTADVTCPGCHSSDIYLARYRMPHFEVLGMGEEPRIIVLDIGRAYTKCGLAGDSGPRCIIPSQSKNQRTQQVLKIWDYTNADELYENLKELLYVLINRYLLVTPKDRRVVVVESLLCPTDFRDTLAAVLFKHYEVASILFAPSHLVSLLTLGTSTGLVLDVGYQDSFVVPVYEGIPIMKGWQNIPLAGKAIHSRIKSQLLEHGTVSTADVKHQAVASMPDTLTDELLEDIKVCCCFVTEYTRGQQIQEVTMRGGHANKLPPPPPDTDYQLDGSSVLNISGQIREHTCEVLFEQDNDETSIATLILDAIIKSPIDTRKALASNVLVIGGTAMMPGFYHRLHLELSNLLQKPFYAQQLGIKKFLFHKAPAKENYTAWLGGALIGALETLPSKSLSRDVYLQKGKLPDWCCIDSDFIIEDKTHKS
ncbi:Actin- protein 10 [Bulinus truncatus]|nr:Actin- protein 10 [Bulinus truncatus]